MLSENENAIVEVKDKAEIKNYIVLDQTEKAAEKHGSVNQVVMDHIIGNNEPIVSADC